MPNETIQADETATSKPSRVPDADPVVYIRERLAEGCSYVILPNELAARVIARETELELDAEMLRAEIEALQRMRHAALKERK
jgi:hypothetical protein